jgi:hypothetical protein
MGLPLDIQARLTSETEGYRFEEGLKGEADVAWDAWWTEKSNGGPAARVEALWREYARADKAFADAVPWRGGARRP